ncbi:MAG: FtsQ-type POTRA domain-containing protein [Nannocystaceae bacterium]|nr:FtsQ-type POTRA domain-containing protein [Nannocystaceae bacterium]
MATRADSSKTRASKSAGNARRVPRAPTVAAATAGHERATSKPAVAPPPSRVRRWLRTSVRVGVRLGLCAALAYGVLVGVREGYAYATTSPRFEVRALQFQPTTHVDEARLRELLALAPGTNILSLELDGLAERITAEPWVARAVVNRELPDALRVEIEEHEAVAVLAAGTQLLVNRDGEAFKRLEPGERGQLPVITGVTAAQLVAEPEAAAAVVARALEVVTAWQTKRRPLLSEVHVDPWGGVTLYTAQIGTQLRLGRGDVGHALARFDALRAAMGDDAEKLAVAHLEGPREHDPEAPERVVASFFPAKDVPQLVVEAHERAAAAANVASDETQPGAAAAAPNVPAHARRNRIPRIPRHH